MFSALSNDRSDIGFDGAPDGLEVLLSRACSGLVVVGNEEIFLTSKKGGATWTNFLRSIERKECLHDGLSMTCEKHPD
jgi:superfamily I DNA and/or RNA helicase